MERASRLDGRHEERHDARPGHLGSGTLACPSCDFPTWPGADPLTPSDPLACSYCGRTGAVREFLTLTDEPRPARVTVTVRVPPLPAR